MNLREYLDLKSMMIKDFIAQIGVSEHTVYNWLNGMTPLRIHRLLVEKVTEGNVKLKDWEKTNGKKEINGRVRGSKVNEVRNAKHLVADKKAKPKSGKKTG